MSMPGPTSIELGCPGCGTRLAAPADTPGGLVGCPICGASVPVPVVTGTAWVAPVEAPRIDSGRKTARRAGSNEILAIWGVVALVAVAIGAYAIQLAQTPIPVVVQAAPPVAPVAEAESPAPAVPAPRPVRHPRAVEPPATKPTETVVEHILEPPAPERKAVDPVKGFDSEAAFDNPTHPGRPSRSGLATFERPPHGFISPRDRPNVPDPSFGPSGRDRMRDDSP